MITPHILTILSLLALTHLSFSTYNPADAREFASASALAYCDPTRVQNWTCGNACKNLTGYKPYYSHVFDIGDDETLSFSMIYNPTSERFVSTFRGTVGTMELLIEIAEGGALPYNLSSLPDAYADNYFYSHYVNSLRSTFISNIQQAYTLFPDYTFVFTGHSLGGALTTIASYDVISQGIVPAKQIVLYNYGSPRVGNQVLTQAVEAVIPELYRVVHWKDTVPHVPPCIVDLAGVCVPGGLANPSTPPLTWHAWHLQPQIFYDESNTSYQVCDAEDPKCSDQFSLVGSSTNDHGFYVGIRVSCDGVTAFKYPPLVPESDGEEDMDILQ